MPNFEYCATTTIIDWLQISLVGRFVRIYEPPKHVFDVNNQVECDVLTFEADLASKYQVYQAFRRNARVFLKEMKKNREKQRKIEKNRKVQRRTE